MLQISLAQTEHFSDNSEFHLTTTGTNCTADETSNASIATILFINISDDIDFDICINKFGGASNDYQLRAVSTTNAACTISWNNVNQQFTRASPGCD